jgi:hypothetical protein
MNPFGDRRKKQTAYGIFAQACWAQYDDEAGPGIEECHIQCSDWWEHLAEKEREKFQSLADRSNATRACSLGKNVAKESISTSTKGRFIPSIPTTTGWSPSHKLYRIRAGCSRAAEQSRVARWLICRTFLPTLAEWKSCWPNGKISFGHGKKWPKVA